MPNALAPDPAAPRAARSHRPSRRRPHTVGGFTLLEMLMTVAIAGLLTAVAVPGYRAYLDVSKRQAAAGDIRELETRLARAQAERGRFPASLDDIGWTKKDPWGHDYAYLRLDDARRSDMRKDRNLIPINTDFDLYSVGPDGRSQPPLTAMPSRDDIVRAANGRFVGIAIEY